MFVLKLVFIACAVLIKCESAFVDTLTKCSIKNDKCIAELYENSLRYIGSDGIPELNMPPIDPFKISNVTVTVLDSIKITLTDGVVKGISKCQVKKFHIDMEALTGTQEFVCDLTVRTNVVFEGSSPAAQGLFGTSSIDGTGKGKVKLEKLFLHLDFPIIPYKKEDGEIYFKTTKEKIKYKYDVDKASFAADKITLGSEDISKVVVPYLNENFKTILKTFGRVFFDKVIEFAFTSVELIYGNVAAKYYLEEDLTPYVEN
ncbi:uncharacterized protein LOC112043071 [Bicyclus anynana]|uniref:Uncharacterized protein LOC112043071 n=1 Tax=Bicyclus anynana TaxID=110368 RepID=A0A6J1MMD5_BICAN|nr:uncharacterized protein LOC112043071 [Bicyclus anynana]